MGFLSWLTGRDEKESDVYANYDKVSTVVDEINTIGTTKVSNAQTEVNAAIQTLNNVKGLNEYVGEIPTGSFDGAFTSITETIKQIGTQIQNKADNIKEYEEAPWYEKVGSTFAMAGAKLGEGLLSVVEDLGDGIVSLVGWIAPKDSGLEKACTNFVKKEWSHDAFNFYYNSDFAKKSAFTEDSALASGFKIVGKTVGTLYGAGVFAGVTGLSGVSAATGFLHTSGTTWAATAVAGVSGLGSGTETGLLQGKDINQAFTTNGVKTGVIQGGLAFAGGKLGERSAIKHSDGGKEGFKAVRDEYDEALKAMKGLTKGTPEYEAAAARLATAKAAANSYGTQYMKDATGNVLKDASGNSIRSGGVGIQGYSDAVTNAGIRFGEAQRDLISSSAKVFAGAKAGKQLDADAKAAQESADKARQAADQASKAADKAGARANKDGVYKDDYSTKAGGKKADAANAKNAAAKEANTTREAADAAQKTADSAATAAKENGYEALKANQQAALDRLKASNPISQLRGKETSMLTGSTAQTAGAGAAKQTFREKASNTFKNLNENIGKTLKNPATPGVVGVTAGNTISVSANDAASIQYRQQQEAQQAAQVFEEDPNNPSENTNKEENNENQNENPTGPENNNGGGNNGGGYPGGGGGGNQYRQEISTVAPTSPVSEVPTVAPTSAPTMAPTAAPTSAPTSGPINPTSAPTSAPGGGGYPGGGGGGYTPPAEQSYTGGGEYGEGGFVSDGTEDLEPLDESLLGGATSIDDIIRNNSVTKVKTNAPITTRGKSSGAGAVIPIAAGLSAAAAAGIGAKAYMDSRNNNDMDEEDDEMEDGEWTEEYGDSQYEADMGDAYLDDEEYGFQASDTGYNARTSEELAELQ